jgi:hypothetical protein
MTPNDVKNAIFLAVSLDINALSRFTPLVTPIEPPSTPLRAPSNPHRTGLELPMTLYTAP